MDNKTLINNFRYNGLLKGKRPGVVKVFKTIGEIYKGGNRNFIVSYNDKKMVFQGLSKVFKSYQEKYDFSINICDIKTIEITKNKISDIITLYTHDNKFIKFMYYILTKDSYITMVNVRFIFEELRKKGVRVVGDYYNE